MQAGREDELRRDIHLGLADVEVVKRAGSGLATFLPWAMDAHGVPRSVGVEFISRVGIFGS